MPRPTVILTLLFASAVGAVPTVPAVAQRAGTPLAPIRSAQATGPLRVDSANPRYFMNPEGRAVYLTGSHTWASLQDIGPTDPPPRFDYDRYLRFLVEHNHNFVRLWTWEQAKWTTEIKDPYWFEPVAFARTGPGAALDGKPRFDLTRFDPRFFERLRHRVAEAGRRGIYVSIMLFDAWSLEDKDHVGGANPWPGHPFNAANNVNGLDGDPGRTGNGRLTETLRYPAVVAVEENYVRHVIDAVNDLDNVLYEITNEGDPESVAWQYHMVDFVKRYEAGKPKRHPVGFTAPWPEGDNDDELYASPADWISADGRAGREQLLSGKKVVLWDTDHLCAPCAPPGFAWTSFLDGLNPIQMDPYEVTDTGMGVPSTYKFLDPDYEGLRRDLGYTLTYANRVHLDLMRPRPDLSSTGHCLAHPGPGAEYLTYLPGGDTVTVDLSGTSGRLRVEWFSPAQDRLAAAGGVPGGAPRRFHSPFPGASVLYLREQP